MKKGILQMCAGLWNILHNYYHKPDKTTVKLMHALQAYIEAHANDND